MRAIVLMHEANMLIKSIFTSVGFITIRIRTFMEWGFTVNMMNVFIEIALMLEGLITAGYRTNKTLGFVKVVNVFEML